MAAPKFVFVKTTSPRGYFGRAGLRFTREWRPLKLVTDEPENLEAGVINETTVARLEAEKEMLAVRPATDAEVVELTASPSLTGSGGGRDKDEIIADQGSKIADLEARLLKLELGGKPAKVDKTPKADDKAPKADEPKA